MEPTVEPILLQRLAVMFVPVFIVVVIQIRWAISARSSVYAIGRMLLQLMLIGYVLLFLFESEHAILVTLVLTVMITISSWIALRPLASARRSLYPITLAAIAVSGLPTLFLATEWVLDVTPWYAPRVVIPLAGMIFANAMNSVSIAAERFSSELSAGLDRAEARRKAFEAALIPLVNSLLAVGLVALPGMMTGQVLAGVSPLIAARYQILVMCMLFGSSGIAAACYLYWSRPPRSP